MRYFFLTLICLSTYSAFAQVPEDALRYSWYPPSGTARNMAIGGAAGSLGGDITSAFVNPAGLGFYKTREFVFTPIFFNSDTKSKYRQVSSMVKRGGIGLGTIGFVSGSVNRNNSKNSSAFSIALNEVANFNQRTNFTALNNYSSFAEQFAEEFARSGYSINEVLNTNSPLPYTSAVGLYTYLIDTVTIDGNTVIKAAPEYLLDSGYALRQAYSNKTGGGVYDLSFAYGANMADKFYWGATLGVPLVYYKSDLEFTETDTSSNSFNHFKSFTYNDRFSTSGIGFNLKLGAIYKPSEFFRIGLALHTPTWMFLTDSRTTALKTELETPTGNPESFSVDSKTFTNNQAGESKYTQSAPWKAIFSASYVFREIENVKKQRGFITADVEYVRHTASRFSSDNEDPTTEEKAYYKSLNNVIKDYYRGTFNFRVGGELKFNTVMGRVGFAYYGNPYKEAAFKANQVLLSGGLGYRNKGFFLDLTYVHRVKKDVNVPYRLQDRANSFAEIKQTTGNVVATFGMKF
jgi:hypothetical protein